MTSNRGTSLLDHLRSAEWTDLLKWATAIFVVCLYALTIAVIIIQIVSHS